MPKNAGSWAPVDSGQLRDDDLVMDNGWRGPHRASFGDVRRSEAWCRITWHEDRLVFVLSNWEGNVCVGATQIAPEQASAMMAVLTQGLVESARPVRPNPPPAEQLTLRGALAGWFNGRRRRGPHVALMSSHADVSRRRSA